MERAGLRPPPPQSTQHLSGWILSLFQPEVSGKVSPQPVGEGDFRLFIAGVQHVSRRGDSTCHYSTYWLGNHSANELIGAFSSEEACAPILPRRCLAGRCLPPAPLLVFSWADASAPVKASSGRHPDSPSPWGAGSPAPLPCAAWSRTRAVPAQRSTLSLGCPGFSLGCPGFSLGCRLSCKALPPGFPSRNFSLPVV